MRLSMWNRASAPRVAGVVAALAVGSLALTACSGGAGGSRGGGSADTIKAAVAYDSDDFDPYKTSSAVSLGANSHTVEGLVNLNPVTREVEPGLAGALPKKIDDTTYEATLRDGAKFADGKDVKATDVVAAFDAMTNLKKSPLYGPMLKFIDKATAKGDKTVVIKLKYPYTLVNERLSLVKVVPAGMDEAKRKSAPIGTGPWKMTSAVKGKAIDFEANEHYNGKHPAKAKKMHWDVLVDDTARVTAMQSGTVDAMESVPAIAMDQLKAKAKIEAVQGFNLAFFLFNTKKAPFDNPKVRQAFFYAVNTEKVIKDTLGGLAKPATSFLPEGHPNYHKAKNVFTHDPAKAKALLAEAGVTNLKVKLSTTDHPWISGLAPQFKNDLKEVGIDAEIDTQSSSAIYKGVAETSNKDFDMLLAPGDPSVFGNDADVLINWWYSEGPWTGQRTGWKDSADYTKLQELLKVGQTKVGAERQQAWNEAMDLISDSVPIYPLFHRQIPTAWNDKKLDNFKPLGTTGLSFEDTSIK